MARTKQQNKKQRKNKDIYQNQVREDLHVL